VPTEWDRYRMIRTYFTMLLEEGHWHSAGSDEKNIEAAKACHEGAGKMKQFASWFTHGVPNGAALRKAIYEARTGPAILDAVERFFEQRFSGSKPAPSSDELETELALQSS
jgi:tRNA-dihydrouridine synthase B